MNGLHGIKIARIKIAVAKLGLKVKGVLNR